MPNGGYNFSTETEPHKAMSRPASLMRHLQSLAMCICMSQQEREMVVGAEEQRSAPRA
jgi:hypothetical protein